MDKNDRKKDGHHILLFVSMLTGAILAVVVSLFTLNIQSVCTQDKVAPNQIRQGNCDIEKQTQYGWPFRQVDTEPLVPIFLNFALFSILIFAVAKTETHLKGHFDSDPVDSFGKHGQNYEVGGTVITKGKKFLLVQERQPRAFELWSLPAGVVENGEEVATTAIRETKEETGFDVEVIRSLLSQRSGPSRPMLHSFEAKIVGGKLTIQEDELFDARFFSLEEIEELNNKKELRNSWVIDSIKKSIE